MKKRFWLKTSRYLISAVILFCGWQTYYYPLVIKTGTVIEWWQIKWAADIGLWLMFPVFLLTIKLSIGKVLAQVVFWVYLFTLIGFIHLFLKKLSDFMTKKT